MRLYFACCSSAAQDEREARRDKCLGQCCFLTLCPAVMAGQLDEVQNSSSVLYSMLTCTPPSLRPCQLLCLTCVRCTCDALQTVCSCLRRGLSSLQLSLPPSSGYQQLRITPTAAERPHRVVKIDCVHSQPLIQVLSWRQPHSLSDVALPQSGLDVALEREPLCTCCRQQAAVHVRSLSLSLSPSLPLSLSLCHSACLCLSLCTRPMSSLLLSLAPSGSLSQSWTRAGEHLAADWRGLLGPEGLGIPAQQQS